MHVSCFISLDKGVSDGKWYSYLYTSILSTRMCFIFTHDLRVARLKMSNVCIFIAITHSIIILIMIY